MNDEIVAILKEIQKDLHTIASHMQVKRETLDEADEKLLDWLSPGALEKITNPRLREKINNRAHH